ncbi:MAG: S41 family peptidase, partial [Shewanella sp.]
NPLDPSFPFVTHIDGLPLSKWIAASQAYLPESTKESQAMQLPWLTKLLLLREDLGLSIKPFVLITLSNDALDTRQLELALPQSVSAQAQSTPPTARNLPGLFEQLTSLAPKVATPMSEGLGTINRTTARLKLNDLYAFSNDPKLQQTLLEGMAQPLLILDLRDASGFSPKLLSLLGRYQDPQAHPQGDKPAGAMADILGFAHYRRSSALRNDHLKPLSFMPLAQLTPSSQEATRLTAQLPAVDERQFSPWFIRTEPKVEPQGHNRLVLLISPRCRQECEWIAYQTKTWSRVQLIGEKTSGDFAKQYRFNLPNSDLEIRLSSALIYDAKGKLLSGNGTEPDIGLPQNTDIEWQGLVSLVNVAKPKEPLQYQAHQYQAYRPGQLNQAISKLATRQPINQAPAN